MGISSLEERGFRRADRRPTCLVSPADSTLQGNASAVRGGSKGRAYSPHGWGAIDRLPAYHPSSMETGDPTSQASAAGALLASTAAQLRGRRDDLEPLVAEYDRVQGIVEAVGDLPRDATASSLAEYGALLDRLRAADGELREWLGRFEPLVREYEQILHVLQAVD